MSLWRSFTNLFFVSGDKRKARSQPQVARASPQAQEQLSSEDKTVAGEQPAKRGGKRLGRWGWCGIGCVGGVAALVLIIIIVVVIALVGSEHGGPPTNIKRFWSADEGQLIRFYFFLEDESGHYTTGDGQASVQVHDAAGRLLFTQEFDFKASDFVDYGFELTGARIGKAYEWRVEKEYIHKGVSGLGTGVGTADLTLTMDDGKVLIATNDWVPIPSYTGEETIQMYEEQYNSGARISGEVITEGNFEVTMVKYGFYAHLKYDTWGDEVTDFRVDLRVANIGSEMDSLYTSSAVVTSGSTQYEMSYGSKLDCSNTNPGITTEGYLLFEDVPETLTGEIEIVAGYSYDASYNKLTYTFHVQL